MTTQRFGLRTILSSTTGRLLTESEGPDDNGIGRMQAMMEWMVGESVWSHQLPRVNEECKPWLLRWFPELAKADGMIEELTCQLTGLKKDEIETVIREWIQRVKFDTGAKDFYEVPRIPRDDHVSRNPIEELESMVGKQKVIVVEVP